MTDSLKKHISQRVIDLVRLRRGDPTLDRTRCETALRGLGMKPGNAQRLLDETTDVQVSRVKEAADLLGVAPFELLATSAIGAHAPALPDLAELLADAVAALPAARWRSVRAQLDDLAGRPEMRDDVLPELRALLTATSTKLTGT